MKHLFLIFLFLCWVVVPVYAIELEAPAVPEEGAPYMPDSNSSVGDGILQIILNVWNGIQPDIEAGKTTCLQILCIIILVSLTESLQTSVKYVADLAGTLILAATLFISTNSMIRLGAETIDTLSEYGKLLFPVMTASLAAQGGVATSAAIYVATTVFSSVFSKLISNILLPMVYLFLACAIANSAIGDDTIKNFRDMFKLLISWSLKVLLTVYTTYISITGVVSGTTDAASLKAAKVTISTFVPVVGNILSDASEAILISASLAKNAAGIYGIFAVLTVFLSPFLKIGIQYLLLKSACALSGIFGSKKMCDLIGDFSTAMGLILAMTGSVCVFLLIATICFMKGLG